MVRNLLIITCTHIALTRIAADAFNKYLPNLKKLWVSGNNLLTEFPPHLLNPGYISGLQELYLNHNSIVSLKVGLVNV